jgi:hypothetical protein
LANFNDRHKDRHTLVGTDLECKWDKPKKTTEPMEIDKIDIRIDRSSTLKLANANNKATQCLHVPCSLKKNESILRKRMKSKLKGQFNNQHEKALHILYMG